MSAEGRWAWDAALQLETPGSPAYHLRKHRPSIGIGLGQTIAATHNSFRFATSSRSLAPPLSSFTKAFPDFISAIAPAPRVVLTI